jgi:hypothetical protein
MSTTPDLMNGAGRQKRVMPSRSRRGGPGIGSTDVDLMILETQKRKCTSYSSFTPVTYSQFCSRERTFDTSEYKICA